MRVITFCLFALSLSCFTSCETNKSDWSELERRAEAVRKYEYEKAYEGDPNFYFPIYKKHF